MTSFNMGPFAHQAPMQADLALKFSLFIFTLSVLAVALLWCKLVREVKERKGWQYRAHHDSLTSCGNRDAFTLRIQHEMERAQRTHRPFALALLDIDYFKQINDRYGHQAGDAVLVEFTNSLRNMLRSIDFVARIGGEEFAILFPETGLESAAAALERVRQTIARKPVQTQKGWIQFTFTAGMAAYDCAGLATIDDIINSADRLMYDGKVLGRNCVISK